MNIPLSSRRLSPDPGLKLSPSDVDIGAHFDRQNNWQFFPNPPIPPSQQDLLIYRPKEPPENTISKLTTRINLLHTSKQI